MWDPIQGEEWLERSHIGGSYRIAETLKYLDWNSFDMFEEVQNT